VLDAILIEAAIAAGTEFRDGFSVDEYTFNGSSVTGIRGRSHKSGAHMTEQARITVGADGRHSSLARAVGAAVYEEIPSLACWYFSYWSGTGIDGLEMYLRDRTLIFAHPTHDGLTAVFIGWEISQFLRVRRNIAASFISVLDQVPELEWRIRSGRQEERFYGTADVPNFFRKPYGPGWALVGDAGNHKDPCRALGICDAFRDAELLGSAIDQGLGGRQRLLDAMAGYEQQRNAASMELYHQNAYQAQFKPAPEDLLAFRAAVRGNQEETNRFFLAQEGMIMPEEFFNPDNLQRLKARADAGIKQEGAAWPHFLNVEVYAQPLGQDGNSARGSEDLVSRTSIRTAGLALVENQPDGQGAARDEKSRPSFSFTKADSSTLLTKKRPTEQV
jgi:2-polyprenyl-6-methoxyphenol hydroxylase-like FAD-dependent oxidoreductase